VVRFLRLIQKGLICKNKKKWDLRGKGSSNEVKTAHKHVTRPDENHNDGESRWGRGRY
jgi:hypothetical protein